MHAKLVCQLAQLGRSPHTDRVVRALYRMLYKLPTTLSSGEAATAGDSEATPFETTDGYSMVGKGMPNSESCLRPLAGPCRPAAALDDKLLTLRILSSSCTGPILKGKRCAMFPVWPSRSICAFCGSWRPITHEGNTMLHTWQSHTSKSNFASGNLGSELQKPRRPGAAMQRATSSAAPLKSLSAS